jgi:hypothetical protein
MKAFQDLRRVAERADQVGAESVKTLRAVRVAAAFFAVACWTCASVVLARYARDET